MKDSKKILVGCDLFLDLQLYHLPEVMLFKLEKQFPNVEIIPVNTPSSPGVRKDIDIYWGNRITEKNIYDCANMKWIHFGSVGTNRARTKLVSDRNIAITNSQGLVIAPMVASAVAFITGLARGIHHSYALRNKKCLTREDCDKNFNEVQELEGQNILIVGLGDVGKRLAKVCDAFGMNVIGIRRQTDKSVDCVNEVYMLDDLLSCVATSDYIVNLLPLTVRTELVFNEEIFRNMKSSSFFINIGRGETVDETILIRALTEKWISGAGLDVFAKEPLSGQSPLLSMENVMLSPHVAGLSSDYWARQVELFSFNLRKYVSNDFSLMRNIVDVSSMN